ncbi:hypothetical protein TorRG33x02_284230 [Trema orientale]|uniref:RNase H type-1 domain-containing protein n=1 Tax=Trema orientale TaxID=63057 RepID=A0A2P5CI61_TREOI|nr:hypothetical protein TorRG33x02_284230 [Trema orientale]
MAQQKCVCFHGNETKPPHFILEDAELWLQEFKSLLALEKIHDPSPAGRIHWSPPTLGALKVNVDAALSNDGCFTGIGVVIKDHMGAVKGALAHKIFGATC